MGSNAALAIPLSFILLISLFGCASGPGAQGKAPVPPVELENQSKLGALVSDAKAAAAGDIVGVYYVGRFTNGTVFSTNIESVAQQAGFAAKLSYPLLTFTVGARQMIPGFDAAVVGMKEGEQKTVTILPADAYGEKTSTISISMAEIANSSSLKVGSEVQDKSGVSGKVLDISNGTAAVELYNPSPLAGETLVYTIKMVSITKL